jgi:hypothetical protein
MMMVVVAEGRTVGRRWLDLRGEAISLELGLIWLDTGHQATSLIHMGCFVPSKDALRGKSTMPDASLAPQTRVDPCLWGAAEPSI